MSSGINAIQTAVQFKTALSTIGSSPVESSDQTKVKGEDTDGLVSGVKDSLLYSVALAAIASAACSMFLTVSVLVDFSSIVLIVLAPIAIAQKVRLSKLGGMRRHQNKLRENVNKFSEVNTKLRKNVSELQTANHDLKGVTKEFQAVSSKYGNQADRLVDIVQENARLQAKIKKNLESQVMQQVLTTVMGSDRNMDFKFDKAELRRLKTSLSNIPGITFDKENFDRKIGEKDLTLSDIMIMFRNLKDDIPEEENIFHITPDKIIKRGLFG